MKYYLIGKSLKHSYSVKIHNLFANNDYQLLELDENKLLEFLDYKDFDGLNITIPYKETSNLVYLYTSQGIITVNAWKSKNPKDKNFGFQNVGNIVSFAIKDDNNQIKTLLEYSIRYSSYKLTESIEKIKALSTIIELINYIPKDNNHMKTFDFILKTFETINDYPYKTLLLFLIKMTYCFGINPNLGECASCKSKINLVGFDFKLGGALCSNCTNNNEYYSKEFKKAKK